VEHRLAYPRKQSTTRVRLSVQFYLADENAIRMDWFWCNFLGRIKLCVRKADADEASSLLE